jgi:hypothetical protein
MRTTIKLDGFPKALNHRIDFDVQLKNEALQAYASSERRSKVRYLVRLSVQYRALTGPDASGVGTTVNLSSKGILISAALGHDINLDSPVELIMVWPMLLDGTVPLKLVVIGRVARLEASRLAISLVRYDFRTSKREPGESAGPTPRRVRG